MSGIICTCDWPTDGECPRHGRRVSSIVCLDCGCPANVPNDRDWTCPDCGQGFVRVAQA